VNTVNISSLVASYLGIRSQREALSRQFEEADAALKQELSGFEAQLLAACNDINANSINTENGTVIRKLNERYICTDWEHFKQFVKDNDALDLFEKRINQGNIKQLLAEYRELPPGVNVMREFGVTVRKPSKE
jgi:hypothetical protein